MGKHIDVFGGDLSGEINGPVQTMFQGMDWKIVINVLQDQGEDFKRHVKVIGLLS